MQGNSKVPSHKSLLASSTAFINVLKPLPLGVSNPDGLKSSRRGRPATHSVINLSSIPLTPRGDGHRNTDLALVSH